MAQILIFGASSTYGVGAQRGGWADRVKLKIHQQQFTTDGHGERHEVFNLGVSGAQSIDVLARLKIEIEGRTFRQKDLVLVLALGGNDAKAVGEPDKFVSSPEDFKLNYARLVDVFTKYTDKIICVGHPPVNDAKTNPLNSKSISYFSSERLGIFEQVIAGVCQEKSVTFLPIFDNALAANWADTYTYTDGLHPNDAGHQWIFEQVWPALNELIATNKLK